MSLPIGTDRDLIAETSKAVIEERNTLRSFLTGIVAATFGALVALHPNEYASTCCAWVFVSAVIGNAVSLIFLIFGMFGRYKGLMSKYDKVLKDQIEEWTRIPQERKKERFPKRFTYYTMIGLVSYIIAIILSCIYVVMDVCL